MTRRVMNVGLLGGSFNPVHRGHLTLARSAIKELRLDKLFLVLSPRSPFKLDLKQPSSPKRLALLRRAIKGSSKIKIGTWELERKGPSYTIDTLKIYKKLHPAHKVYLVMGSDSWKGFFRWKSPGKILELCTVAVGRRPGTLKIAVPVRFKSNVRILKGKFPKISSRFIRSSLSKKGRQGGV